RSGEPEPPQLHDRLDPVTRSAISHPPRCRRAIDQARLTRSPITTDPLACTTNADSRPGSRRCHRPTLNDDELAQPPPPTPTEHRVTVKPHPVSSLSSSAWLPSSLQGGPDEPTSSGTTS